MKKITASILERHKSSCEQTRLKSCLSHQLKTRQSDPQVVSIVESESLNSFPISNPTSNSVNLRTIKSSFFYCHVSEMVFQFYHGAGNLCCLGHYPLEDGSFPRQWQMSSYLHINCFKAGSVLRSGMLFCKQTSSGYLSSLCFSTIFWIRSLHVSMLGQVVLFASKYLKPMSRCHSMTWYAVLLSNQTLSHW